MHPFVQTGLVRNTVTGREHIHQQRPCIYIGGPHTSYGDTLLAFGAIRGPVTAVVANKVFRTVGIKQAFTMAGFVPTGTGKVVEQITAELRTGHKAMAWGEGKCYTDGTLHEFRTGIFVAAMEASALVVPFGHVGVSEWWPLDGRPHLRHPRMELNFGPPIDTHDYASTDSGLRHLIADARKDISRLSRAPLAEDVTAIEK
jgi:1-acyl-sn-glycerol-3-phosphate acyltransferase